jgi:hypothetical protein
MRNLILAAAMVAIVGVSPGFARGGHGHSMGELSQTPDARLTGSAPSHHQMTKADTSSPTQLDPEDAKVDKMIKNICRGC